MSITTDLKSYADSAISAAQAQLNDVSGQANEFYGKTRENVAGIAEKATITVNDLRQQAEKAVNIDAIKTAVEPYVAQVKGYTAQVTDRAESLFDTVKGDPRFAKLVDAARPVVDAARPVVETVSSLAARGTAAVPTTKPASKASTAAAPKPSAKPAATKPAATKPASKPAARKAPAKRATQS